MPVLAIGAGGTLTAAAALAAFWRSRQNASSQASSDQAAIPPRRKSSSLQPVDRVSTRSGWDVNVTKVQTTHQLLKGNGTVLKPLQLQDGNGQAELAFYKEVQAFSLAQFCPKFYGCEVLEGPEDGSSLEFLEIEDLTSGCNAPAVMDLKMGTKKFYIVASQKGCADRYPPEKCARQAKEDAKRTSGSLGFLVSGVRVPAVQNEEELCYDSIFGKDATDDEAKQAVREFVTHSTEGARRRQIAGAFASKVRALLAWYQREHTHVFYNCSLLFVFDAAPSHEAMGRVEIRLIDFCHAWRREPSEEDLSGVPLGLKSLLNIFDQLAA
eukprot:TRINITY_DN67019_c0_g1_i1.p1 TRINITY_DN67019_c0_g1~~TRINITY_DN67019_c0_g1_i1.p1  ORF type:complete len:325 (+),score=65.36 TRINITY_DN67019_c0_g1_i1:41-1015(+)